MWKTIENQLLQLPYFGVSEVGQLLGIENIQASQVLLRWLRSGKVIRLKRGIYMSREYHLAHKSELGWEGMIAGIIQPSSYLSREYVLYKYGVMTEAVYLITSVTSKNTQRVSNLVADYEYRHIKSSLYGGYREEVVGGVTVREASPAKALFDYFYLRPGAWIYEKNDYDVREDLRLNLDDWGREMREEFASWVTRAKSPKMDKIQASLRRYGWE